MKEGTDVVEQITSMNFVGNITPKSWFKNIRTESTEKHPDGQPYLLAICILSDVVFFYRMKEERDEETGTVTFVKRFAADKLQRSYNQIEKEYGVSKRQAKAACDRLCELNLLTREFRTVEAGRSRIPNVMYLEPVPAAIAAITDSVQGGTKFCSTSYKKTDDGGTKKRSTNTENTNTENTTENLNSWTNEETQLQVLELFHEICSGLPKVRSNGKTQAGKTAFASMARRAQESGWTVPEDFKPFFKTVARSEFLNGKNNRTWRASFAWLMNATNFEKVLSGNYGAVISSTQEEQPGQYSELYA